MTAADVAVTAGAVAVIAALTDRVRRTDLNPMSDRQAIMVAGTAAATAAGVLVWLTARPAPGDGTCQAR